jgi:hypothetical protein
VDNGAKTIKINVSGWELLEEDEPEVKTDMKKPARNADFGELTSQEALTQTDATLLARSTRDPCNHQKVRDMQQAHQALASRTMSRHNVPQAAPRDDRQPEENQEQKSQGKGPFKKKACKGREGDNSWWDESRWWRGKRKWPGTSCCDERFWWTASVPCFSCHAMDAMSIESQPFPSCWWMLQEPTLQPLPQCLNSFNNNLQIQSSSPLISFLGVFGGVEEKQQQQLLFGGVIEKKQQSLSFVQRRALNFGGCFLKSPFWRNRVHSVGMWTSERAQSCPTPSQPKALIGIGHWLLIADSCFDMDVTMAVGTAVGPCCSKMVA